MLTGKRKYSFLIPLVLFAYMGQMMLALLMPCCNGLEFSNADMAAMKAQVSQHQDHMSSMSQMTAPDDHNHHAMDASNHADSNASGCSLECGFCGVASLAISALGNSQKVSDTNVNPLSDDSALLSVSIDSPFKPPISA